MGVRSLHTIKASTHSSLTQGSHLGASLALSRVEGSARKPFDLESLDLELETERLRAERFTPPDKLGIFDLPGVHLSLDADGLKTASAGQAPLSRRLRRCSCACICSGSIFPW